MAAISAILRGNSSAFASLRLSSYCSCSPLLKYVTSDEWSFYCNPRVEFDVGADYRYHKRCCYHSQHGISPKEEREIKRCLLLLELDSTDITLHKTQDVKSSYVRLVKKYHPDKMAAMEEFGISSDSTEKFHEIHHAYEVLLKFYQRQAEGDSMKTTEEQEQNEDPVVMPQHRKYLNYEGVGYGSPSQRKRQYDSWRADKASERVFQFKKDNLMRNTEDQALVEQEKEHRFTRKIKTSNMLLRMADDMIKESMAKGDFDNLPGSGKPLKSSSDHNPYVDSHSYRLNSVLINNGYAPQWMTLESEIKSKYRKLKGDIHQSYILHNHSSAAWKLSYQRFKEELLLLNKKIDTLNMIAPSLKTQMVHYNPDLTIKLIAEQALHENVNANQKEGAKEESESPY